MGKRAQHIEYEQFSSTSELPEDEQSLLQAAMEAASDSYAPHSNFHVGCALLLEDGEVMLGNNQENIAYPSGLCAERVALFYAGAQGKGDQIRKIAIRANSSNPEVKVDVPVTPCGACRQVMYEYELLGKKPIVVLMQGANGDVLRVTGIANSLLPFGFNIEI